MKLKDEKKLKVYLDTSVLAGVFDIEDHQRVEIAKLLFALLRSKELAGFISRVVLTEILKAPEEFRAGLQKIVKDLSLSLLEETEESLRLAQLYVEEEVIPETYRDDARHIALAVSYDLDFLISWNYKHMVNIRVKRMVNAINLRLGYKMIDIVAPEEVIRYGEVES